MKAGIFDMDGLLIDTEKLYIDAFAQACKIMEKSYSKEVFEKCIGVTMKMQKQIMKEYYGEDYDFNYAVELIEEEMIRYIDKDNRLELKHGVIEILEKFKKDNMKLAVATSTANERAMHLLKKVKIAHYFDEIITGDMVENSKPAPDIFLLACEKIGVKPNEAYVFEDSYNGVRAGHAGGFYTVMIPDILKETEEMKTLANDIQSSLLDFVEKTYSK